MKRIFIGSFVNIDKKIYLSLKKDFGGLIVGRWSPLENLHITFKFIGNIEEEKILKIRDCISPLLDKNIELSIRFKGLGVFPTLESPKILYIKVEDNDGVLKYLNSFIENSLNEIGFKKEIKPFIPHITVNRIKETKLKQFIEKLKKYQNISFGAEKNINVNIIESVTLPTGAVYKKLDFGEIR